MINRSTDMPGSAEGRPSGSAERRPSLLRASK